MSTPSPRRLDPCPCGSGKRYKDCHGSLRPVPLPQGYREAAELRAEGRVQEALALLDASLAGAPDALLLNLRGLLRQDVMDLEGAMADFDTAIARDADYAEAHQNRGMLHLLRADYARGWADYAWRTRIKGYADYANFGFGMPRWNREDLAGRSILVHAEQGQGDTIQFARFVAPLARAGAAIDVFCHPPLATLMGRIEGVRRAVSELRERPTHDFHAPIMDVGIVQLPDAGAPHWFGPYIRALPDRVERFAPMLSSAPRPLVGISWKGSPRHVNDRNRSLTRELAQRLLAPGATYVNLQIGEAPLAPPMIDAAREISDWDDTAAVVAQLDRVISVDTALAHLAGAMDRPVTLLLPFSPDWRWRDRGTATPWYPRMTLVRQSRRGEWSEALEEALRPIRRPGASPR